jgi:hypothetical protein
MKDFLGSLLSRKLLITVAGFVYFISMGDINQALALALGYIGIQGGIEAIEALKTVKK